MNSGLGLKPPPPCGHSPSICLFFIYFLTFLILIASPHGQIFNISDWAMGIVLRSLQGSYIYRCKTLRYVVWLPELFEVT